MPHLRVEVRDLSTCAVSQMLPDMVFCSNAWNALVEPRDSASPFVHGPCAKYAGARSPGMSGANRGSGDWPGFLDLRHGEPGEAPDDAPPVALPEAAHRL